VTARTALVLIPLLACIALAGCEGEKKKKAPPVKAEAPVQKAAGLQPPSQEVMDRVKQAYEEASKLAKQANALRIEGERLETESGMQAAKGTYRKAIQLYQNALGLMEEAMEPELNDDLTEEQVDAYLRKYQREIALWSKSRARMGKVPE
jgi:tetratricopeptide (TPR) repeat protein